MKNVYYVGSGELTFDLIERIINENPKLILKFCRIFLSLAIFSPNSYGYGENFCFIASSTQIFHNFDLSFGDAVGTLYLCNVIEGQK